MSDGIRGWGGAKITAVQRGRVNESWRSGHQQSHEKVRPQLSGGRVKGWKLLWGECVCSVVKSGVTRHMKGPALAEEEALSNSTGYYFRRRLNRSLKNTQTVFSQQQEWHATIYIKRLVGYLRETPLEVHLGRCHLIVNDPMLHSGSIFWNQQ